MVQEGFSSMDADGLDADADEEVNRIYAELTAEILIKAPAAPSASRGLKTPAAASTVADATEQAEAEPLEDEEMRALNQRLQNL